MKRVEYVSAQMFFEAVANEANGSHSMSKKDDIVIHILTGPDGVTFIPIKDIFEELDGDDVVRELLKIGLIGLIPFLVPGHDLAKTIRRMRPRNSR